MKKELLLFLLLPLFILAACMPSVKEKNPNISFLSQSEFQELLIESTTVKTKGTVRKYTSGGTVEVCVNSKGKCFDGTWSINENGELMNYVGDRVFGGYMSIDMTFYSNLESPYKWKVD